jgi:hypothetical protein
MKYLIALAVLVIIGTLAFNSREVEATPTSELPLVMGNSFMQPNMVYIPSLGKPYYDLVSQYDWCVDTAYKIMGCESSLNPNAINVNHRTLDYSVGLFQVNLYGNLSSVRPSKEWLLVPENNIEYAYQIWLKQGYSAWRNCYRQI